MERRVGEVLVGRYALERTSAECEGALVAEALDLESKRRVRIVALDLANEVDRDPSTLLTAYDRYRIGSRSIVPPLGVVLAAGPNPTIVVVYEYKTGERIDQIVTTNPSRAQIARIVRGIAQALTVLHDQGVAHGALRPDLVAVDEGGVWIEGFAFEPVVRTLAGARAAALALPAAYRAPELGNAAPEPYADVYALGVMTTELLLGRLLTSGDTPPTPQSYGVKVSVALEALLQKAVAPSPEERGASMVALAERLAEVLLRDEASFGTEPGGVGVRAVEGPRPAGLEPSASPVAVNAAGAPPSPSAAANATLPAPGAVPQASAPAPALAPPAAAEASLGAGGVWPTQAALPVASNPALPAPAPPFAAPQPPAPQPPMAAPVPTTRSVVPAGRGALLWMSLALGLVLVLGGGVGLFVVALMRENPSPAALPSAPSHAAPSTPSEAPETVEPPETAEPPPAEVDASRERTDEPDASVLAPGSAAITASLAAGPLPIEPHVPKQGGANALVTVVVFGDFECPQTKRMVRVVQALSRAFADEVRIAWRHRPLPAHLHAYDAALVATGLHRDLGDSAFFRFAAEAAGDDEPASRSRLQEWVARAGGDPSRVNAWLSDSEVREYVKRDLSLAGLFDVRATPTLFINGRREEGFYEIDDLRPIVDKELAAARSTVSLGTALPDIYTVRVRKNLIGLGSPVAERTCPPVGNSPVRGSANALVTLVEFSDFECSYCKKVQPTLETLLARYDARLVWKNFPIENHPRARVAASLAAEASGSGPSKFWRVHDLLFAGQPDFSDARLSEIAQSAGMDAARSLDVAHSKKHDRSIEADVKLGAELGVRGTPTFFINGRLLSGAAPMERFEAIIREEVDSARRLLAGGVERSRVYATLCGVR